MTFVRGRILIKTLVPVLLLSMLNFAVLPSGAAIIIQGEEANVAKAENAAVVNVTKRLQSQKVAQSETFSAEVMRQRIKERRVRGGIDRVHPGR